MLHMVLIKVFFRSEIIDKRQIQPVILEDDFVGTLSYNMHIISKLSSLVWDNYQAFEWSQSIFSLESYVKWERSQAMGDGVVYTPLAYVAKKYHTFCA